MASKHQPAKSPSVGSRSRAYMWCHSQLLLVSKGWNRSNLPRRLAIHGLRYHSILLGIGTLQYCKWRAVTHLEQSLEFIWIGAIPEHAIPSTTAWCSWIWRRQWPKAIRVVNVKQDKLYNLGTPLGVCDDSPTRFTVHSPLHAVGEHRWGLRSIPTQDLRKLPKLSALGIVVAQITRPESENSRNWYGISWLGTEWRQRSL